MHSQETFRSQIVRSATVGDLHLTETRYPASTRMGRHEHKQAFISIVLQGAYDETIGSRTRECRNATVSFHPPCEGHSVHFLDRRVTIFRLDLSPQWLERVESYTPIFRDSMLVREGLPSCLGLRLYHEFCTRDAVSALAMEGLALELSAEASRVTTPMEKKPPTWLLASRDLLHARFADPITVAEISEQVGVHPVHLARTFRAHFRTTVGDYVRRLRVETACRRLAHSDDPLVEIALDTGFVDQGHFSRTFKQLTELTPSQYRKTFRGR